MRLFTLVSRLGVDQEVRRLGQEIARRLHPQISPLAQARARQMTLPELRGYLRARAGGLVKQQTTDTLAELGVTDLVWHFEVASHALESLIQSVVGDLVARRPARAAARQAA
ncbi:MAG: hypothetical protein SGJ20_02625 [Planctomycetota bacterium]|nr:hypothetical protein [Planctomycetota bacterium]